MAAISATPAAPSEEARRSAYVSARAAQIVGDSARAAELYAALARSGEGGEVRRQAVSEALAAGRPELALSLARALVRDDESLPIAGRLLLVGDALRRGDGEEAKLLLGAGSGQAGADFLRPYLSAWLAIGRGIEPALAELATLARTSPLASYADEHRALLLLKARLAPQAEPPARRAIGSGGGRENRIRLAMADGFLAAGDRARALAMLEGREDELASARADIAAGRKIGMAVGDARSAYVELLLALAIDLNRADDAELPLALARIAQFVDPASAEARLVAALLLEQHGSREPALALLATVPPSDPLAADVADARVRMLVRAGRAAEAVALARGLAKPGAGADALGRLGDALAAAKRPLEAAAAYASALEQVGGGAAAARRWPLLLLMADQWEDAGRWPESKRALEEAARIAPDQAVVLNYLGYAMLERGEELARAEALVARASALAPDNASITDSLGWAHAKLGRLDESIATLQRAAAADPAQAEIHEHLGDVLYRAGRRFEARHAWSAALLTADDEQGQRLRSKLEGGLSTGNAAP